MSASTAPCDSVAGTSFSCVSECNCIIEELLVKPFSARSFTDKLTIVSKCRPTPLMPNLKSKAKNFTRHLKQQNYVSFMWLCGCKKLTKLYCWPCLLFSTERSTIWTKSGFTDLSNLHNVGKRHELSQSHIASQVALKKFGKTTRIEFSLSEQHRINIEKHNEQVKINRHIVGRLIDVTCFLAEHELPFRGHNESEDCSNRGNYIGLINLLRGYDDKLNSHLERSTVFCGLSSDIQNDLIDCVSETVLSEIKLEIKEASFVALIMDETTDITNKCQVSTVLRYVNKLGDIHERFLGFADLSNDRRAKALAEHVFKTLDAYQCEEKLVAQTYDGAAVMSGDKGGLQAIVKVTHKHALFVHCYAHKMNLVLRHSVDNIKECKLFFSALSGLASYFKKSSKRSFALDQEVKKRFPSVAPTRWNYNSRLVLTVFEKKKAMLSVSLNP